MPSTGSDATQHTEPGRAGAGRARSGAAGSSDAELTDAELIGRSRQEPDCFAAIFDRHADEILRYAHARLGPDLAEDVIAETFLAAFRRRDHHDTDRADARPGLYGSAIRLIGSTGGPKAAAGACSRRCRPTGWTGTSATAAPAGSPPSSSGPGWPRCWAACGPRTGSCCC